MQNQNESLVKPGFNGQFIIWLILIGVPALLLFLVYSKTTNEQSEVAPQAEPAAVHQPAH